MIYFSPVADGSEIRDGWYRGRVFREHLSDLVVLRKNVPSCVPDDHVYAATAVGEDCFK